MNGIIGSPAARVSNELATVLIVDDNEVVASTLSRMLSGANFASRLAFRGRHAIQIARECDFEAAVVDVHLPDLNGLVVVQRLREIFGPRVPIVVVSGDTSMEVLNSLTYVGATHFFGKPLNVSCLLHFLEVTLGGNPI